MIGINEQWDVVKIAEAIARLAHLQQKRKFSGRFLHRTSESGSRRSSASKSKDRGVVTRCARRLSGLDTRTIGKVRYSAIPSQ